ncbi:MAG: leucine-rich repeat domain-containing protein, partial [Gammaproteobacteria bacterium]|nr:leucine-rich repeat domain-containing protein [Gammaproteobacteria bacterium]
MTDSNNENWTETLWKWADDSDIPNEVLPRDRDELINLTELYIIGDITKLPKEIGNLTNLTKIFLEENELTELPKEIGNLVNLTKLSISITQLSKLPKEIGNLVNLTELNLSYNQLDKLPKEIGKLINLTKLNLEGSELMTELPKEIGNLVNLKTLNLSENDFTELPKEFGLLNLSYIDLHETYFANHEDVDNILSNISPDLVWMIRLWEWAEFSDYERVSDEILPRNKEELVNLTEFRLFKEFNGYEEDDYYDYVPKEIFNLINLHVLDLSGFRVTSLPKEIGGLVNLRELYLVGNKLTELPKEIGSLVNLRELYLEG